jgi:hypothetical protein
MSRSGGLTAVDFNRVVEHNTSTWFPPYEGTEAGSGFTTDYDAHIGWNYPAGRTLVSPTLAAERNHIFFIVGQSNSANFVNALYTPSNAKVHQVNLYDGAVYQAKDPLLGPSSNARPASFGSIWGKFGDLLINNNKSDRVILVPIGIGSAYISLFCPTGQGLGPGAAYAGIFHDRILIAIRHMLRLGYVSGATNVTKAHLIFMQGVGDAYILTSQANWQTMFGTIRTAIVNAGWTPDKTFVPVETKAGGGLLAGSTAIAAAQAAVNNGTTILGGQPNFDSYDNTNRYDGAHLTATGRDQWATDWYNVISPYM